MLLFRIPNNIHCVKVILEKLSMPIYAVAVGRKVGIYNTYEECKLQVLNYPKARFKKFERTEDAEAFIKQFSGTSVSSSYAGTHNISPLSQMRNENINPPELIKIEKISPKSDLFSLTQRISCIEEKLNKFMTDTISSLENLAGRVKYLESKASDSDNTETEPPTKKLKTDFEPLVGELKTESNGFVSVYTDGACSKNGQTGAQAGVGVWFNDNHPLNISAPVQGPATNNNAEIQAARIAVTQAYHAGIRKLTIYTDSKFVINCITSWINKWKKNNWLLTSGGPVKNKDELVKLDNALQLLDAVEWKYVAGHRGIRGNEMADKLAREGASQYKTNVTYARDAELCNVKFFDPPKNE